MKQKHVFSILIVLLALSATHCGPQGLHVSNLPASSANDNGLTTGGTDPMASAYSTMSPADEVSQLKNAVGITAPNQNFASEIKSAAVTESPLTDTDKSPLQVQLKWDDLAQPLVFSGDLTAKDKNGFISELTETSGQRPDLKIEAQCVDKPCHHGDLILEDADGHKAGIIVNKENRIIHMKLPDDENADQLKNTTLDAYKQDRTVEVTSTEIIPGKSSYSIREIGKDPKAPALSLDGALFDPNGEAIPTTGNDVAQKLGNISLVGKDNDQLIFRVEEPALQSTAKTKTGTTQQQPAVAYLQLLSTKQDSAPTPTTTVASQVKENCPVHVAGQVHPWINSILKDCTHPTIAKYIHAWTVNKGGHSVFTNFLRLYHQSFVANKPSQALDFHLMLQTLAEGNFPQVWSDVTLVESNFNWTKKGGSGEIGVWQIMPSTAEKVLNLPREQAKAIVPATKAAVKYYKEFTKDWGDDVEMLLASYNSGKGENYFQKKHTYSKNFWVLCQWGMLKRDQTCVYVPRILSAMIVSLDPAAYGVTEVGPMEAK